MLKFSGDIGNVHGLQIASPLALALVSECRRLVVFLGGGILFGVQLISGDLYVELLAVIKGSWSTTIWSFLSSLSIPFLASLPHVYSLSSRKVAPKRRRCGSPHALEDEAIVSPLRKGRTLVLHDDQSSGFAQQGKSSRTGKRIATERGNTHSRPQRS